MKTIKRIIRILMVLFIIGLTASCSPEDGKDGEQGLTGEDGNANVTTTGWISVQSNNWYQIPGAGSTIYTSPGDIGNPFGTNGFFPLNSTTVNGAILVYVDNGSGARICPSQRSVSGGGKSGGVEFRFAHATDTNYAMWLEVIVALRSGEWDINYMKNTYLPSLKWKVVTIPANDTTGSRVANKLYKGYTEEELRAMSYEEVKDIFNLKD